MEQDDDHELPASLRPTALRLLHNINSLWGNLPSTYYLNNLEIDSEVFAHGGEAIIRRARLNGALVAVRQYYSPQDLEPGVGKRLLEVCSNMYGIAASLTCS